MTAPANSYSYKRRLGLAHEPSAYQAGIFDWIENDRGNGVVDAVAGAGKSSTSVWATKLMLGTILVCAFNKEIVVELKPRLAGTGATVGTVHRHGLACVRWFAYARNGLNGRVKVKIDKEERKYPDMLAKAGEVMLARAEEFEVTPTHSLDDVELDRNAQVVSSLCGEPVTREQIELIRKDGWPVSEANELCKLARLFLLDFDAETFGADLDKLAERYDIAFDELIWPLVAIAVQNALRLGCEIPEHGDWAIDFTDMLWLPNVLRLRPKQYDWVIVDECQDLSTAARRLLMASTTRRGRMLFVGDPKQAINGFAGADDESFDAIVRETRARVLPLSVCYRCPESHLAIARQWRSDIEARPGAPVGTILRMERGEYVDVARRGDLVLCRRTAPLVQLCFELIASGVSANVRGRADVSKGLVKLAKRASKLANRAVPWAEGFDAGLNALAEREAEKINRRAGRSDQAKADAIEALGDRIECVRIVWRSSTATSLDELLARIEQIFADQDAAVTLSTVHRAKGLEAERVAILEYDRLQSLRATQPWQIQQEQHLAYVAYTRSTSELIEIPAPKRER